MQYTNGTDLYLATDTKILKMNESGDGFDVIASIVDSKTRLLISEDSTIASSFHQEE